MVLQKNILFVTRKHGLAAGFHLMVGFIFKGSLYVLFGITQLHKGLPKLTFKTIWF